MSFRLPTRLAVITLLVLFSSVSEGKGGRKPKPPLDAKDYPMHETHPLEHVTIAAEPGDVKDARPDTRLNYFSHQMMPIRVIVTNDSDDSVLLDDARIHFVAGDNTSIDAATDDDLERRMFTDKSATGTRLPLGLPIPITVGKKNVNKDILADDTDFGFKTTTVKPHTTEAGYLFYDVQGLDSSPLAKATLELRKVRFAKDNKALETFEISLHPSDESK